MSRRTHQYQQLPTTDVLVDIAAPLFSMFALLQDILRISDDIAAMAYDQNAKEGGV